MTAPEVVRAPERVGFELVCQRGSHRIYRDTRGRRVTVPFNPTEALHPNLLRQVLKDSGLTVADIKEER
ncbi:MAG TPA: addiction module toxin, HicA family [Candidatus Acetothermia bacterium]|nr:addiction module toxin, HicA family [Candidatus Acetothermia bacterium]